MTATRTRATGVPSMIAESGGRCRDTPVPASGPLGLAGLLCCANVGRFADGWDIGGPFAWLVHDDAVVVTPERAAHYGDREHPPVRSAARQGAPHRSCEHWRG